MDNLMNDEKHVRCKYACVCTMMEPMFCRECKNNTIRNMYRSYFEKADDKPFPEKNTKAIGEGMNSARYYICPVCDERTHQTPCGKCGYSFDI